MKAHVLKATHQPLTYEERPALEAAPGEAIVQLKATALNRQGFLKVAKLSEANPIIEGGLLIPKLAVLFG